MRQWRPRPLVWQPGWQDERDLVAPSEREWLTCMVAAREAYTERRKITVLVVDPEAKTVREEKACMDHFHHDPLLVTSTVSCEAMAALVGARPMEVHVTCIADCASDGAYVNAVARMRINRVGADAPGFEIFGAPYFGVVALVAGTQLCSPKFSKKLEVATSLRARDVPEPKWLTPGQINTRRSKRKDEALADERRRREALGANCIVLRNS